MTDAIEYTGIAYKASKALRRRSKLDLEPIQPDGEVSSLIG